MRVGSRRCRAGVVVAVLLLSLALAVCPAFADVVYLYDGLGRLVRVIDASGQAATYIYDPVGNILQIARQTGVPQDQTTLVSVDPPTGAQGSQVTLTFTGTNLVGASLPALPAGLSLISTGFSVSGNLDVLTMTLAIDPEQALGPQSLTLVSALGQTPFPFSLNVVRPGPRVDRLIPPIVTIGTLVQIEGAAFDDSSLTASQVTVNGVTLPVISASPDALIAQIPLGVATGPVRVTTAQGTGTSSTSLAVVPATHPQQNAVTATLQAPFRNPIQIALSPDGIRAYIVGRGGFNLGTVTAVDTTQSQVVGVVPVSGAFGVAVTPDSQRVLVPSFTAGTLTVINALTLGVVATIPFQTGARAVAVSPDGRFAYVSIDTPAVAIVDLGTLTEVARIGVSGPTATFLAVAPDGNTVYAIGSRVSVIDAVARQALRSINTFINTQSFALDPVAQRITIAGPAGPNVGSAQVLDLQAGTILQNLSGFVTAVGLNPDRTRLFAVDAAGLVTVLNAATLATLGTVSTGAGPSGATLQALVVSADGATLWVASPGTDSVRVVDTQALALIATVPVGRGPIALGPIPARPDLYVLNQTGNMVSVIDTATNTVRPTAALDGLGLTQPLGLVVPAGGATAFVANGTAPTTVAFTPTTGAGLATLPFGDSHTGVHLAAALSRNELYAGLMVPLQGAIGVAVLDLPTRALKRLIPVSRPIRAMVLSLDERRLYVATDVGPAGCVGPGCQGLRVLTFDTATGAQLAQFTLDGIPATDTILVHPDGTRLYTLHPPASGALNGTARVIDTGTQSVLATILVGRFPARLALDRPARRLYVTSSDFVSVIDTATNQVAATITLNTFSANNMVFSLDGSKAYLLAGGGVRIINTATNTIITNLFVASRAVAISPDGQRVLATKDGVTSGTVAVIDTSTDQVVATIPVGTANSSLVFGPLTWINVTFSPDGTRVWVVNTSDDSISVIQ